MKSFILLSALAAVALAAPYQGEEQFTSDVVQDSSLKINEREKKSPIPHLKLLGQHIGPQIIDKKQLIVNKPIIIKKKLGYHLFRSSDEEQADSSEKCAKQIKVKLCDDENLPQVKNALKSTTIEDMNVHLVGDDMEQSVKLAKEAVENLQRDLKNMEKSSIDVAHQTNLRSADLHEDIEIARQALEHVHNNFGNFESFSLVAPAAEDLMKEVPLKPLTEEDKRMAEWHTAMKNIQKNVEVARNIEDNSKSASEPQIMSFMVGPETDDKLSKKAMPFHSKDETEEEIKRSNNVDSITEKSELARNTNVGNNVLEDVLPVADVKNVENINKEDDMNTSASEKKETLVALNKETMDKMTEQELVDHLLKLTDKQTPKPNEKNRLAETNLLGKDQMIKDELNKETWNMKSANSNEKIKNDASVVINTDVNDKFKEVESQTQDKKETMALPTTDLEQISTKLEKAATPLNDKQTLETKTKSEKSQESLKHVDEVNKTETILKEAIQNSETLKKDNIVDKTKKMADDSMLKSAIGGDLENSSQSSKLLKVKNSADTELAEIQATPEHHHHHHHHHHEISETDVQKAVTEENDKKMLEAEGTTNDKKENDLPLGTDTKSPMKSAIIDGSMSEINEKLKTVKDDNLIQVKQANPEIETLKSGSNPELSIINHSQKHMALEKSADSELETMTPQQHHHHHHHEILHQKSTIPQQHENSQFHHRIHMNADKHSLMNPDTHLATSFDAMDHARNAHFVSQSQMAERESHSSGRMNMMPHGMDSSMQPSMQMDRIMDPMSKSAMEYMQWKHGGKSASYGAPEASSGSGGAVGLFPHANVGNCAIPLLLSCNPSVVSGSLAKSHSGYSAPSYRAGDSFNYLKKRDVKVSSFDQHVPASRSRTSTLFKNTPIKNKTL